MEKRVNPVRNHQFLNGVKQFNIVISGVGGQGLISILRILARAAQSEGYEVKSSELHGLAQRGGSVEAHLRFGEKIFSPLISCGKANLIISLELQECLKAACFAGAQTTFLANELLIPIPNEKSPAKNEIMSQLKEITDKVFALPASEICEKELGTGVTAGVYLIAFGVLKEIIPLSQEKILTAMKNILPAKHLEINEKTFELAKNDKRISN